MELKDILQPCLASLDKVFSDSKINEDFWNYCLNEASFTVAALNEHRNEVKVVISKDDTLTVLSKIVTHARADIARIPLIITIGIGKCEIDCGSFKVSKCHADLLYNDILELVDIDFFVEEAHRL